MDIIVPHSIKKKELGGTAKNLQAALDDLANSTPEHPSYDVL